MGSCSTRSSRSFAKRVLIPASQEWGQLEIPGTRSRDSSEPPLSISETHLEWGRIGCVRGSRFAERIEGGPVFDRDSQDLFLGKKALDRNLITPAQLREAMSEQARSRTPSGSRHVPLGEVFIARNYMSRDQLLALLDETARVTGGSAQ